MGLILDSILKLLELTKMCTVSVPQLLSMVAMIVNPQSVVSAFISSFVGYPDKYFVFLNILYGYLLTLLGFTFNESPVTTFGFYNKHMIYALKIPVFCIVYTTCVFI